MSGWDEEGSESRMVVAGGERDQGTGLGAPEALEPLTRQLLCEIEFLLVPGLSVGPESHLSPQSSLEAVKYYRAL